jgi:hypothetical protein
MLNGILIGESLRVGSELTASLTVTRVRRGQVASATGAQPTAWTLMEFEAPEAEAGRLAAALAECLAPDGGWYTDFHTADETFVVFAGRVFRYPRGDAAGRAEAVAHALAIGVPEAQVDWRR